ncbi:MAG: hypothetical protein Q9M36_04495 [Sulfurovum sp.]|nr:hypothetical protein [Sulfurovum sp.]
MYQLTHDYYPALNYLYLHKIRAYINAQPKEDIIKEAKEIWQSLEHKIVDWWSFIARNRIS